MSDVAAATTATAATTRAQSSSSKNVTLFLCGDVMTGRGIDQMLPHPGAPHLYEAYMRSAIEYVKLAERASGSIPRPASFDYVWGDALTELDRLQPDVRIANLETAVAARGEPVPDKGIHYHMNPENIGCLTAAGFDALVLANNHMLDFGCEGLDQTLETLHAAGIRTTGAGDTDVEAAAPAIIDLPGKGRVLLFAWAMASSGVMGDAIAEDDRCGVNFLSNLSEDAAQDIARQVQAVRQPNDIVVTSLHWGDNWGFTVFRDERAFAHRLIDVAGVDVVYGHSSHHPKGIEVYNDRPILYGCGDFLNDYEGIQGYEEFRGDLTLMYFPTFDAATGKLERLVMTPMQIHHFRLRRAPAEAARWLAETLNREGKTLGTAVNMSEDGTLQLSWT